MTTAGLLMMIGAQSIILSLMIYFFSRVLRTPKREEPDSYSEND